MRLSNNPPSRCMAMHVCLSRISPPSFPPFLLLLGLQPLSTFLHPHPLCVGVVFICLGVPVFSAYFLYKNKHRLHERGFLQAQGFIYGDYSGKCFCCCLRGPDDARSSLS